jgi:hypothetical protein
MGPAAPVAPVGPAGPINWPESLAVRVMVDGWGKEKLTAERLAEKLWGVAKRPGGVCKLT